MSIPIHTHTDKCITYCSSMNDPLRAYVTVAPSCHLTIPVRVVYSMHCRGPTHIVTPSAKPLSYSSRDE